MEKTLEELRAEADALGIEYPKTMGATKLAQKIEEHYRAIEGEADIAVAKEDAVEEEVGFMPKGGNPAGKKDPETAWREHVAEKKKAALAKRVVTVTSNDKRDNDMVTAEYISVENQYFAISRLVPLDVPVELEQCLIDQAEATMIPMAVDEYVNGQRTGNKVVRMVKKFNVSYGK